MRAGELAAGVSDGEACGIESSSISLSRYPRLIWQTCVVFVKPTWSCLVLHQNMSADGQSMPSCRSGLSTAVLRGRSDGRCRRQSGRKSGYSTRCSRRTVSHGRNGQRALRVWGPPAPSMTVTARAANIVRVPTVPDTAITTWQPIFP